MKDMEIKGEEEINKIVSDYRHGRNLAIISPVLLAELEDVIVKKFPKLSSHLGRINKQIKKI